MNVIDLALAGLAAIAAGVFNALAGGGTLISFPVLVALGVPPIAANVTNAVALCPGYFGATLAQLRNLKGQKARALVLVPAAAAGGLIGAFVLVHTQERTFTALIPWMLTTASVLLAVQEPMRALVLRRAAAQGRQRANAMALIAVVVASIYGGFFSAGMSVLLVAVLGLTTADTFGRLNALKQVLASVVNVAAVLFFLWSGHIVWAFAGVMAIGALLGGALGGRLALWMKPAALRWAIVAIGFGIAIVYWVQD